jgi:hypothetical protein
LNESQPFAFSSPVFSTAIPCEHRNPLGCGVRTREFTIHPNTPFNNSYKQGYPDGDFFSSAPALSEALSSLARTNLDASEFLLRGLVALRLRTNNTATNLLPDLYSPNVALLKSHLESVAFSNAVALAITNTIYSPAFTATGSQ